MKKIMITGAVTAGALLLTATSAGAEFPTGPCVDSGGPGNSDYARHHIVEAVAGGDHVPGTHGGFSLCLETGRNTHKP